MNGLSVSLFQKELTFSSLLVFLALLIQGCYKDNVQKKLLRFELLDNVVSGVDFNNILTETDSVNYFTYPYIYMGGGVSVGDINNDALPDIFFTGNMVENRLYLNKGDLQFEDITHSAHLEGDDRWYTGSTMADVNTDGYLDLYLSVSGLGNQRRNELYINNGDNTFTEQANKYGIADNGNSIQSTFFDYDNDGDLDLYVANYPITSFRTQNFRYKYLMNTVTEKNSDRLYENQGEGVFIDVTEQAGLLSFGLSISATIADFNADGWQDIYVSNDFSTPDYFFMNNGDGTFSEKLKDITKQTAFYGMGADAADINNDGLMDFFQVDMSAEDNRRAKANMASMDPTLFWSTVNNGFHYQYMYNALQLNRGLAEGIPVMSNIASLAGVTSTDWSWSPLFADLDNDGWKDLFVSNGTRREINNKDFFKKVERDLGNYNDKQLLETALKIPSEAITNYIFKNRDGLQFENAGEAWGITQKAFSNGCAYADLDNDGDLELVINNIDSSAHIYKNNTIEKGGGNYLKVVLSGKSRNVFGVGAEITVFTDSLHQVQQVMPTRGFQSSVEPVLHFGIGEFPKVDSLLVRWPRGNCSRLYNLAANQRMEVSYTDSTYNCRQPVVQKPLFSEVKTALGEPFAHIENNFNDYTHQVLLPHKLSNFGPGLAVGDVNGDGIDDFYIGGAAGKQGTLCIQEGPNREFLNKPLGDARYEDVAASFFDADNDGDLDLYVVSGGNEFPSGSENYQDRFYLNNDGVFTRDLSALPSISGSGSCVRPHDFDQDGDIDLFVGGRHDPRNYPYPGRSYLLINTSEDGALSFEDQTADIAPDLADIGMITDAVWMDYNGDNTSDLIVVGEWMPILGFAFKNKVFAAPTNLVQGTNSRGWWFSIEKGDLDNDGDDDLIVGNLGLNYKYKASDSTSFDLFVKDFDGNTKEDIILSYYNFGKQYPVRGRQCSSQQIPKLSVVYEDYNSFSTATVQEIFGTEQLAGALHYQINSFASIFLENKGEGDFLRKELPSMAQLAPINDIIIADIDGDSNKDILVAGNLYASEVETPRADAGIGLVLRGDGHGHFTPLSFAESGLLLNNDTKFLALATSRDAKWLIAANNQGPLQLYEWIQKPQRLN
ncbi:MAG: VCBS repeat-containing protein [Bacteroidota bacterium]